MINILGENITITSDDYISLTDMLKAKDGEFFISDWLRNRNTVEYLGIWERIHNPNFNYGEFATIKNSAGLNSYKISVKEWVNETQAVGLKAKTGRYGGTYAHKDIAFEFAMWISAEFKIYLIKEFQRLKESEQTQYAWNARSTLTKMNYRIHTDAIQKKLLPPSLSQEQIQLVYANEADVLNMALYGITAKQWRQQNPNQEGNIRDYSSAAQLVCLANLESINAVFINDNSSQPERLKKLNSIAISQMQILLADTFVKSLDQKQP